MQRRAIWILVVFIASLGIIRAQVTGDDLPATDSTIVFRPVRPLMEDVTNQAVAYYGAGANLLLSASGWAFGGYYGFELGSGITLNLDAFITGRRNTDEFDNALLGGVIPIVAEKVNRLLMVPVTMSLQYRLFRESLQETFRPYVAFGATAATIVQAPYIDEGDFYTPARYYEFFESFGYATTHFRPGIMLGFGSTFGPVGKGNQIGVSVKYYTIPFGGDGLESIRGKPITDFGGLVVALSIGTAW